MCHNLKATTGLYFVFLLICSNVHAGVGEDIAASISKRYETIVNNCGGENNPAYECSGVILHGEDDFSDDMPWSPSSDDSMSYSFFRADVFNKIFGDYDYGIILTPDSEILNGKFVPDYKCAFPVNGDSNGRQDGGCGKLNGGSELSETCQSQGIFTLDDFIPVYEETAGIIRCGWDLRIDNPAEAFKAMTDTSAYIISQGVTPVLSNNEVVIASWGDEALVNLPIDAIFYADRISEKSKTARNLENAMEAQLTYYNETGSWLPVIHMKETLLEPSPPYRYTYSFSYNEDEQGVLPPAR